MKHSLVYWPNPILRSICKPVIKINKNIKDIISDMKKIMTVHKGIGLSAPQIGEALRIIIYNNYGEIKILINPIIYEKSNDIYIAHEGCLSFPNIISLVDRNVKIRVKGLNEKNYKVDFEAEHLEARIIQHEIDHLDGIIMLDKNLTEI